METKVYDPICTLYRDSYPDYKSYLQDYHECRQHYGYRVRVVGGWKFFEFERDYWTWKGQK